MQAIGDQVLDAIKTHWNSNEEVHQKKHCVYFGEKLALSEKFKFRKERIKLHEGEELVFHAGGKGWKSGFAFTNFGVHFDTVQDGFFLLF
jgi:hypothetical protein